MNNGKKNRKKKKIKIDIGGLTIYLSDDTQLPRNNKILTRKIQRYDEEKNNKLLNGMNSQKNYVCSSIGLSRSLGLLYPRCSHTLGCF